MVASIDSSIGSQKSSLRKVIHEKDQKSTEGALLILNIKLNYTGILHANSPNNTLITSA